MPIENNSTTCCHCIVRHTAPDASPLGVSSLVPQIFLVFFAVKSIKNQSHWDPSNSCFDNSATINPGGGWVLQISSDGDDQRIFWGFEIFDSGIFLGRKFGKYIFWWLDLSRDFLGYLKQLEDLW